MFFGPTGTRKSLSLNSSKRTEHDAMPPSPQPPVTSVYENLEGSGNDESPSDNRLEDAFMDPNEDSVSLITIA